MTKKSKAEQVEEKVQDAAPAAEQAEQMEGADAARQPSEEELKAMLRGEYGKLPAPVNEEVRKMAIGDDKVITCRPADLLKPEMDKYREEIRDQATCEEDVLSYALFPKVAPKFFEYRSAHQTKIDSTMLNKDNKTMPV